MAVGLVAAIAKCRCGSAPELLFLEREQEAARPAPRGIGDTQQSPVADNSQTALNRPLLSTSDQAAASNASAASGPAAVVASVAAGAERPFISAQRKTADVRARYFQSDCMERLRLLLSLLVEVFKLGTDSAHPFNCSPIYEGVDCCFTYSTYIYISLV